MESVTGTVISSNPILLGANLRSHQALHASLQKNRSVASKHPISASIATGVYDTQDSESGRSLEIDLQEEAVAREQLENTLAQKLGAIFHLDTH